MRDVMIDLETMSSASNAAIVSIGAVFFDEKAQHQCFYRVIDLKSDHEAGGRIDADTIMWWMRQTDQARSAINPDRAFRSHLVLQDFATWLANAGNNNPDLRVWGNGATFDNVVLRNCYMRHGSKAPWSYRGDRCFRTIKDMFPVEKPEFGGTAHNALDDAINQAKWLQKICATHNIKLG